MAVKRGDWWTWAHRPLIKDETDVTTGDILDGAVTCSAIADGHVVSEKASANLMQRSVMLSIGNTVSSAGGFTSEYILWQPITPVVVNGISWLLVTPYENATGDVLTLFGNAGTSMSGIALTSATGYARGTRIAASAAIHQAALASGTDVVAKLEASTCSAPGHIAIQLDYYTTG